MGVELPFKLTRLGVVPRDWEVTRLGDLSEFVTSGSRGWAQFYAETGALFIRSQNVQGGMLCLDDQQYVKPPSGSEGSRTRVVLNDLLITITGNSVGNVALVDLPLGEAYISQHVGLVRPKEPASTTYICRYLSPGSPGNAQIVGSQSGQSKPGLNLQNLKDFLVALPASSEERGAITCALGDIDALLAALDRLIAKKRDLKQAAMQQLLTGQTRLPGFQGEWKVTSLRHAVTTPITDGPHLTPEFLPIGVPFLSVNNLIDNRLDFSSLRFISVEDHIEFSKKCKPRRGDILFGKAASVGMVALIETDMELNIWSPLALIRVVGNMHERFAFYALQSSDIGRQIKLLTNASSQGNIGMSDIGRLEIPVPAIREQEAIAAVLSDMDAELTALKARRDKTRSLKQGMMQELLTGRTRLVDAIPAAPVQAQVPTQERKANIHFLRAVLAAEIVDQLHQEPTFGHVKLEKMVFLAEHLCQVDTGSTYLRKAAGPLDRKALHSIDSQLRSQQWFEARKQDGRYTYVPLPKRGGHKTYFDRYYAPIAAKLSEVIETFRALDSERCEIVATLYAAWNDLLRDKGSASDDTIVHEVLNHWHEAKQRISEDRWRKALDWMREKGFVPQGAVLP